MEDIMKKLFVMLVFLSFSFIKGELKFTFINEFDEPMEIKLKKYFVKPQITKITEESFSLESKDSKDKIKDIVIDFAEITSRTIIEFEVRSKSQKPVTWGIYKKGEGDNVSKTITIEPVISINVK